MTDESKAEAGAEAELPEAKAPKTKRTKAMAEAKAQMEACMTLGELGAIWMGLKPDERDRAVFYKARRRIETAGRQ